MTDLMHAICLHQCGGVDGFRYDTIPVPVPGEGEVLIRQHAIGLNFIDIYHRTGFYPLAEMPAILGMEGAGEVVACGPGATAFSVGDRVAYGAGPMGGYAEYRTIPETRLVRLPDEISYETAAAVMLKGLTAHYLLRRTYTVGEGAAVLVHAAAGGVGQLLCQWASHLGALVIGTVSTEARAEIARRNGCQYPIVYTRENFVDRVRDITNGQGVNVVYDSVGQATFMGSLDCLMRTGLMVSYGQSSGAVPPIDIALLAQKGSLFLTRPSLMDYVAVQSDYLINAAELFQAVMEGHLQVHIEQRYPLSQLAQAHDDLEHRRLTGSSILIPDYLMG